MLPARTGSGLSVLVIDRSAEVFTVVVAVEVLGVVGSAVPEETEAVLERFAVWAGSTVTTIVIAGAVVTPSEARVQVTVVVPVQVQPVPLIAVAVADKVALAGRRCRSAIAPRSSR